MTRTQRPSPIPRLLGPEAEGSALALLGLSPAECTPQRVEVALQRQLDRVAAHPEGETPEADEVRLALHAAAAQLSDPEVRRMVILEHTRAAEAATTARVITAQEPNRHALSADQERAIARAMAMNHESGEGALKKLLFIGAAVGAVLVVGFVGVAIVVSAGRGRPAPVAAAAPVPAAIPTAPGSSPPGPAGPSAPVAAAPVPAAAPGEKPAEPESRSAFTDAPTIVRGLQQSTATAKTDPATGLSKFRAAIVPLAEWWPKLDPGQRRAADAAVIEFLYALSNAPDSAVLVIDEIQRHSGRLGVSAAKSSLEAGDVWPASWATGLLARLSVERELPRGVAARVAESLNAALGAGRVTAVATFEDGALAALRRMPPRLVAKSEALNTKPRTSAEAFKRWVEAITRVGGDEAGVERALVDALEQVLIDGPEPSEDPAAYEAVEILATRIRWRETGPARGRLLEWFNDGRVTVADMNVLTSIVAGKSNAENVSPAMILSASATTDERAQMRSVYASAWGLTKAEARDSALAQWRQNVDAFIAAGVPSDAGDDVALMVALVQATRYNEAARQLWLGDGSGAKRTIEEISGTQAAMAAGASFLPSGAIAPLPPLGPGSGKLARTGGTGGGFAGGDPSASWGESFLRAERNIPVRIERLKAAELLAPPLSRLDASLLVQTALFGSPAQVRLTAQQVVMKFPDDPAIVLACLDHLPVAPKVRGVSEMLERIVRPSRLPKLGDPDWEITARRALVDRLLSMLAAQSPQAAIDQGTLFIASAYERMAGPSPSGPRGGGSGGSVAESAGDRASRSARDLFGMLRLEADRLPPADRPPMTPDQIERRLASRLAMASGPVQQFAAEQVALAEMLAYVICAERPVQSTKAREIAETMVADRRSAKHIFQQMIVTEQAMSRLWALRFGEQSARRAEGGGGS